MYLWIFYVYMSDAHLLHIAIVSGVESGLPFRYFVREPLKYLGLRCDTDCREIRQMSVKGCVVLYPTDTQVHAPSELVFLGWSHRACV